MKKGDSIGIERILTGVKKYRVKLTHAGLTSIALDATEIPSGKSYRVYAHLQNNTYVVNPGFPLPEKGMFEAYVNSIKSLN